MKSEYVYIDGDFKVIKEQGFKNGPIFIVTELSRHLGHKRRFQYHYMDDMKSSLEEAIKFIERIKNESS